MKNVYLLWHENPDNDDAKLLGVYSSYDIAAAKIRDKYTKLIGFSDYPNSFTIDEYQINKDEWEEGFVKYEED